MVIRQKNSGRHGECMMKQKEYLEKVRDLAQSCVENGKIDVELYGKYDVQRGLRDKNGNRRSPATAASITGATASRI